jgi:hypothetical protein
MQLIVMRCAAVRARRGRRVRMIAAIISALRAAAIAGWFS